ncbi:testis-expressed protein 51 isoform X2 [Erinaceus europaeus]|uniref:Testis-expressed protein 51 isoform X2 n=1 Tax=Erinaceus europaeus TaxID=9365 RepID=A0ABM3WCE5_ERIEU|nr:testis-expressed protein 51 isoform X2 [Erinaceus europaeus]
MTFRSSGAPQAPLQSSPRASTPCSGRTTPSSDPGQEHLEEEAAKLFNHIEESIKKMRDNKQLLMDEIHVQKKLFSKKLSERSEELKEKVCNSSCDLHILEVMDCARCKMHYLTCRDAKLCPGRAQSTYIWAASLFFIIPLASIAGGGYYFFWIVKKKKEEKFSSSDGSLSKTFGEHLPSITEQRPELLSRSTSLGSSKSSPSSESLPPEREAS